MTESQADRVLLELHAIRRRLEEIDRKLSEVLPPRPELTPDGRYELAPPPPEGG